MHSSNQLNTTYIMTLTRTQKTAALQPSVFVAGIHQKLVVNIYMPDGPCATIVKAQVVLLSRHQYQCFRVSVC